MSADCSYESSGEFYKFISSKEVLTSLILPNVNITVQENTLRPPGIGTSASQKPRKPREVDVNNIVVPEGPPCSLSKPFCSSFA